MGDQAAEPSKGVDLLPYELFYPPAEARQAAKLVQDEISSCNNQLDRLRLFAAENTNLINLVRRLPDELSHDVMVPFGKAAFFPGRLIHTNEFLVLLGDGYHADQTAKQTIGVLKRRGQALDSKVQVLDTMISDLLVRAKFYEDTANESGEGMVEIREYEEYPPEAKESLGPSNSGSMVSSEDADVKTTVTDEEYAKILARFDELEREEVAAESASFDSDDENIDIEAKFPKHQIHGKGHKVMEEEEIPKDENIVHERVLQPSKMSSEQAPAFTGTIVEHSNEVTSDSSTQNASQAVTSNPSRPVSRFKLRKGW